MRAEKRSQGRERELEVMISGIESTKIEGLNCMTIERMSTSSRVKRASTRIDRMKIKIERIRMRVRRIRGRMVE